MSRITRNSPATTPGPSGAEATVAAETVGVATTGKLTRNDVAALMGVSPSTVIRREQEGVLRAELVGRVHVYDETEVRRTIATSRDRSAIAALGGTSGDVAALVFTELDAGANEIEIVKRHAIAPEVVKGLVAQYREFRGEVAITASELSGLREQLRLARAAASPGSGARLGACMVCARAHRVRACAACLASQGARLERRTTNGMEEVRYVVEAVDGTTCVAEWTTLAIGTQRGASDP